MLTEFKCIILLLLLHSDFLVNPYKTSKVIDTDIYIQSCLS